MTTPETEEFGSKLSKVAELHQRVLSASAARLADWKTKSLELQARFAAAEADIQSQFRRLADREREIGVREKNLEAKELELESSESQLLSLKNLIAENVNELGLVEKRVAETKERVILVEKSLEEKEGEVGVKENELAQLREEVVSIEKSKEIGVREMEEREVKVQTLVDECEKELEMKRGKLCLVKNSVAKCSSSLETIKREIGLRRKEFCLLRKSMVKWCSKLEGKERETEGVFERFETRGKNLEPNVEGLLCLEKRVGECLKDLELRGKSLANSVSDELTMKELQVKHMELEREKHVALLEKPNECKENLEWQIEEEGGQVRLQLKLSTALHSELGELLEYTPDVNDMIIPSSVSDQTSMIMDVRSLQLMNEQLERVELAEAALTDEIAKLLGLFGGDPQVTALFNRDGIVKFLGIVSQLKKTQQLCQTHGMEKKILDIIRNLIGKKKLIEAVRFICTFKLDDKLSPVPLLKEFVDDAKKYCIKKFSKKKSSDEKEKIVDDSIADLRAVIQCIKDYSLEPLYPSIDIEMEIHTLGILKQNQKVVLALPSNVEIQEQRKGRKRSPRTSAVTSNYLLRSKVPRSLNQNSSGNQSLQSQLALLFC